MFAVIVAVRHLIYYMRGCRVVDPWKVTNLIGMFCIGGLIYYNVRFVHDQTMLLGNATRMDAATGLYNHEYFYEELEKRMDASGKEHQFTVSLGVAEYEKPWNTASMFFDQADQALYQAKNTGKNRVCSS